MFDNGNVNWCMLGRAFFCRTGHFSVEPGFFLLNECYNQLYPIHLCCQRVNSRHQNFLMILTLSNIMFVQCLHLQMGSFLAQQMALLLIWWGIYKSIHSQLSGTLTHQEQIRLLPRKDCGTLHHNWAFHAMVEWKDRYITVGYITKWSKGKLWLQFRANITAIVWQQAITCNHADH